MSGARRKARREARRAAEQLLKSGVNLAAIGRVSQIERLKSFMLKVVDAAEKRLETGEGTVTVREGIAATQVYLKLEKAQQAQAEEPADEFEPAPVPHSQADLRQPAPQPVLSPPQQAALPRQAQASPPTPKPATAPPLADDAEHDAAEHPEELLVAHGPPGA